MLCYIRKSILQGKHFFAFSLYNSLFKNQEEEVAR